MMTRQFKSQWMMLSVTLPWPETPKGFQEQLQWQIASDQKHRTDYRV